MRLSYIVYALLLASTAYSVHWVGGEALSAADGTDSSWYLVRLYYSGDTANYITCDIVSYHKQYLCDIENIPGHTWQIGDEIIASIEDDGSGYFAGPVSVITTGGDRDEEPVMQLRPVIDIVSPADTIYTEEPIDITINSVDPYSDTIWYNIGGENITLCNSCNNATGSLSNLSDGSYRFYAFANDSSGIERYNYVDLDVSTEVEPYCGDLDCQDTEDCGSCSQDCGVCGSGGRRKTLIGKANQVRYRKIIPSNPVVVRFEDSSIDSVVLAVKNQVGDLDIKATRYQDMPPTVDFKGPGTVYEYLEIKKKGESGNYVDNLVISFKVERLWVEENAMEIEDIVLSRYRPDERSWERLSTEMVGQDENFVYFEARSGGLSTFVISAIGDSTKVTTSVVLDQDKFGAWISILIGSIMVFTVFFVFSLFYMKKHK